MVKQNVERSSSKTMKKRKVLYSASVPAYTSYKSEKYYVNFCD